MATWYVRPDTSHSGTRDGTSYATAWGGWSEIVWGSASGVRGSTQDTLYVCGTHTTASITIGAHGGASSSQIATIRGDFSSDPGTLTLSGSAFITASRSFTTYEGLTVNGGTASSVFFLSAATMQFVTFNRCTINRPTANGNGLSFDGANGTSYADIAVMNCAFSGDFRNASNATGAINWLVSAAAAISTMTRVSIVGSTFSSVSAGRGAIQLRIQSTASASSRMQDMRVERNTFRTISGVCIEVNDGHTTFGNSAGLYVGGNTFSDVSVSSVDSAMGGCMLLWGFTSSSAMGRPVVENNSASNISGAIGLVDFFYGNYLARWNTANTMSTPTIDANGVLFDFSCDGAEAYGNSFYNLTGKSGVSNSGVAIMVLSSTNIKCYGNLAVNCKTGVFFGAAGGGQSAEIAGNTFVGCTDYGINIRSSATPAGLVCKNNAFTGSASAPAVNNDTTAWTGENYNAFSGMAAAVGHTLGANDIAAAQMLSDSFRPLVGSPLIGAGTHIRYSKAADGIQRPNPPSIGAYDVATLRRRLTADPAA